MKNLFRKGKHRAKGRAVTPVGSLQPRPQHQLRVELQSVSLPNLFEPRK